jgi:predicted lipoprotein
VVIPLYAEFETEAGELQAAADAWSSSGEQADHEAAQAAWRDAMEVWQRGEVTQFGPAGLMNQQQGGQDLRDQIYSWPLTNACRIDQEIVREGYTADDFDQALINVRGLDAMEYLLFAEGYDNACAPNSRINSEGTWDALSEDEIDSRRAAYAARLAAGLVETSGELHEAWSRDGGNFAEKLAMAGAGSELYPSSQEALNSVSDAMFYLEKETKDMKLARPLGLTECSETTCPEERESLWADASLDHVRANIAGFEELYYGGSPDDPEALGFDDLLRERGATDLADEMDAKWVEARAAFDALEGPMVELLADDRQALVDAHTKLRAFVTLFKTQFVGVLDLELPKRAEGDND